MKVLVTGAQGCIGSWVVKKLLEREIETIGFDLDGGWVKLGLIAPSLVSRARAVSGRIEDTAALKALVRDAGITHIVHLAAQLMPFCQKQPVSGALINVIGTLNVFEAARDAGRAMRIVYASSSAVWGPEEVYASGKLSEDNPLKPSTHYGIFKQANEGNARVFFEADGIPSIGLRPWTVYGAGRDKGLTADPTLAIQAVAENRPFTIRLTGQMDLQYVEDVAETFIRCLLSDLTGAHAFNLEGAVISMDDFIGLLDELRPGARGLITASGPHVPVAYRMDGAQLRFHIPGIVETPLREGVTKTLALLGP